MRTRSVIGGAIVVLLCISYIPQYHSLYYYSTSLEQNSLVMTEQNFPPRTAPATHRLSQLEATEEAQTPWAPVSTWRSILHNDKDTVILCYETEGDPIFSLTVPEVRKEIRKVSYREVKQHGGYLPHGDVVVMDSTTPKEVYLTMLGRVRKFAVWLNGNDATFEKMKGHVLGMSQPCWERGPSSPDAFLLRRPNFLLTFGVTGGVKEVNRAVWAEKTWGRRTPVVWYSDVTHPTLMPHIVTHPLYEKDKFAYLSFKMTAIWQHVFLTYYQEAGSPNAFEWYIRLWDDNFFYEENFHRIVRRLPRHFIKTPACFGKVGVRVLSSADSENHKMMGGGAGWFITAPGMQWAKNVSMCDRITLSYENRRGIFLPHRLHDEDILLSICMARERLQFYNIPGVEHVSPGMNGKQRCLSQEKLKQLRWDDKASIIYSYPTRDKAVTVDGQSMAYSKPIVWHYMSPLRLVNLEVLLYPERSAELSPLPQATPIDIPKPRKKCYPGVPDQMPAVGLSVFDKEYV